MAGWKKRAHETVKTEEYGISAERTEESGEALNPYREKTENPEEETKPDSGSTKSPEEQRKENTGMTEIQKNRKENKKTQREVKQGDRQSMREAAEGLDERRKKRIRFRLSGSRVVKAICFILLILFCAAGIGSGFLCGYMMDQGYYEKELNEVFYREFRSDINDMKDMIKSFLEAQEREKIIDLCQNRNIGMDLILNRWDGKEILRWSIGRFNTDIVIDVEGRIEGDTVIFLEGYTLERDKDYIFRFYINPQTSFNKLGKYVSFAYNARYMFIGITAGLMLLVLICFIFILYSAGHEKGREDIVPGILTRLPLDIMTLLFAAVESGLCIGGVELGRYLWRYWYRNEIVFAGIIIVGGTTGFVLLTVYFMDLARRVKMGKFWRNSLLYMLFGILWKGICFGARGLTALFKMFPSVVKVILAYLGICILEFIYMLVFVESKIGFTLWGVEKILLLFLIVYISASYKKLFVASGELARGQEDYRVDTSKMLSCFKEHGENLNSVGQGISRAVEEKMKSEHLKTELITNVSHDLKTPLTSIINYADLICAEASEEENEKIQEYAEVLLRQSRRLKKLLEDLMEASKAATGNLEVNLVPCEVGVLLSQIVGEYQRKMEERELELIARQPEQPAKIIADGRYLWRVFDNLMNNICKYAQEKSRVYLNVELKEERVLIVFRNMSKYALDISGEELEERFVRGDKSRHMEGNGLGLSIAKSLMDLQNGEMEIIIDGDLFKVILSFKTYEEQLLETASEPLKLEVKTEHEPTERKMKLLSVHFGNSKEQKK